MKKIVIALFFVGLLCVSAFPFKLGLEFQVGGDQMDQMLVASNMRISEAFELKPQIGFKFSDPQDLFVLGVDGNFYLPELGKLQHYAGPGINLVFESDRDATFGLNGHYGLRYDINEIISIFGQVGLNFIFSPDFELTTNSTGIGCTFFIIDR